VEQIQGYQFAIDLNDGGMTRALKTLRDEAKLLKSAMQSNFTEIKSGEGVMAAYAQKVKDAGKAIDAQNLVIDKLREKQNGLDQSTEKGRQSYIKYENQIESAKRSISNLQAQQERAAKSLDLQRSGILKLKEATELEERSAKSNVSALEAQGRNYEAQKVKLTGLVSVHERMKAQLSAEKTRMAELSAKYGSASKDAQEQSIRVSDLTAKYKLNEAEIRKVNSSVGGMSTIGAKARDNATLATDKVKSGLSGVKNAAVVASGGIALVGAAALSGAKKASTLQNSYKQTTNLLITGGEKAAEATKNVSQMQADGEKYSIKYGKSQKDIADQYQELIKRGYTSKEALGAMRSELQASVASGDDFSDVVSVASQTVDAFGMRTNNTAKMTKNTRMAVNELAYASDMTATSFQSTGKAMEYVGDTANSMKVPLSMASSAIGELSNHGLEADKAGTGLRKVLISLGQDIGKIGSKGDILTPLGINKSDLVDANGNLKSLDKMMAVINDHTKNMGTQRKNVVFNQLFGTTGQQAGIILAQNNKELGDLAKKTQEAGDKGKYVQELANKNSQTAQMSEARFKQAWSDLTIMFGSKLLPYMTDAANRLSKLFSKKSFHDDVEKAAKDTAKVAGEIEKAGVFAAKHTKEIKDIGIALAAIWTINKMAKFKSSLVELGAIQSRESKRIAAETELVDTQTAAYAANAKAKLEAAQAGSTGSVTSTAEKGVGEIENTAATVSSSTTGGAGLVGDAEKAVTKSGSKWNLLGKSLGGRLINGAGLALTAWDAGSSIAKAVGSGKAQDKYKAVGKTAGTVIGGAIGAIGGPTGAMIGASIGDQLGSTKTAQKITKGLAKAFKQAKTPKIKVEAESSKKAYSQLTAEAKKYYSAKQKQDKADIALLYKNGDLTKAEYQKRLKAIGDESKQASKLEKLSQADRNAITKYYAQSRAKLETTWNKKIASDKKKWDNQILKDTSKYGANSEKVQKDQAKKVVAIKADENKKSKALDQQKLKFSTQTTVKEAKLYTTLNGKIQQASNKQEAIIKKLNADKGKLSNKQLQTAVNTAEKEYKQTVNLANQEYNKRVSAANNTHDKVVKAAERQLGDVRNAANKQYKDTVSAANNQYKGNSKWAEQQRADVKKKAEQQRDSTIKSAEEQANRTEQHAEDQRKQVVDKAENQRSNAVEKSKRQRKQVVDQASAQSKGVVDHSTNQANSSMEANKKQGEGTHSIWTAIANFFNTLTKPFGVKSIDAGASSFAYTRATSGAYATGGGITKASKALVGEAGVELKYQPWSGTVDLIGAHGPEFIDVKPGDQILNAQDTQKVLAGNYGRNLPGYAKGTTGIAEFLSKIKSGASDVFDDVSDAASDALSKITNPKKALEDLAAKTFNINSVSGVGSMQRGTSKGMVDKSITSIADALKKLIKSASDAIGDAGGGKGAPSGSGVQRWKDQVKDALKANGLSTSQAMIQRVLRQIITESTGNPKAVQPGADPDGDGSGPAMGLMQTKRGTFTANAFPGHGDIFNGYDNLLAALHYAKARYGAGLGFLGNGHGYANGGIVTQAQIAPIAEGNLPEAVVPLDLSKRSRAYQVMQQSLDYFKGQDGANNVVTSSSDGSTKQLQAVIAGLTSLNNSLSQLLGVNVAQVKAIQQSAFSKDQLYRQQARDQGYKTSQSLR
jgi:TP901 family phage tail tape measure protein